MKNFFNQSSAVHKEAYAELKKVTWLSRKEVIASTVVVIIIVIVVAIYVGFVILFLPESWRNTLNI